MKGILDMELRISNFNKPSNKKFKKIADALLYTLPATLTAMLLLPMAENTKIWITFAFTMAIIAIKTVSKFTTEGESV